MYTKGSMQSPDVGNPDIKPHFGQRAFDKLRKLVTRQSSVSKQQEPAQVEQASVSITTDTQEQIGTIREELSQFTSTELAEKEETPHDGEEVDVTETVVASVVPEEAVVEKNPNFHESPSLDELAEKLLQPEQIHLLEKYGITAASIEKAKAIAQDIARLPNEAVKEKLEVLREHTKVFMNDKSNFEGYRQVMDMVFDDNLAYVQVNPGISGSEGRVDTTGSDEELIKNPENYNTVKLHMQVPDHLVPFVGLLMGQAIKIRQASQESSLITVPVGWKMFAGFASVQRAEIARIVYYIPGQFTNPNSGAMMCFENGVDVIAPIAKIMDIGGLREEVREESDVVAPSFNTSVKVDGAIVPNLFVAMGHSHLRREMERRGILGEVFDPEKNYAVAREPIIGELREYT